METVSPQREAETLWSLQKPLVSVAWMLSLEWAVKGLLSHRIPHQPQDMLTYNSRHLIKFLKSNSSCTYMNFNRNVAFLLGITTSSKQRTNW